MSELKRCPFCGITLIADGNKFFVHPVVGCLLDGIPIKNDAESIKRWNTRKPMQNIVERLEKELKNTEWIEFEERITYRRSIKIVKEEGEMNE